MNKNYLLIILYIILIFLLLYFILIIKHNNIERFSNSYIDVTIPNLINGNMVTVYKKPVVELISGDKISGNANDKKYMVFPSIFYFPYKNYIGNFHFYKYDNTTQVPNFTLSNVRLIITNFNTEHNYLLYVSLKKIVEQPLPIFDLSIMDFNTGKMKFINSNNDLQNCYFNLDPNNYFVFNNNKQFNVKPINKTLELTGTILTKQEDLVEIKSEKNGEYFIIFDQVVDIQLNNYKNTIQNNNFGLYKNFNILKKIYQ